MSDDELFDDLFGPTSYETPTAPARREFKPWHKPRKQYIRELVWRSAVEWVLREKGAKQSSRELSYLGLPGEDLLDLRYFHSEFIEEIDTMRFLGFDTSINDRNSMASISLQEVKNLERVAGPASDVRSARFEDIGRKNSVANQAVLEFGAVDVINIDLCDDFSSSGPTGSALYEAFATIFGMQKRRADPWCILLTTRVGASDSHRYVGDRLLALISDNLSTCDAFAGSFRSNVYDGDLQHGIESDAQYFDVITVGYVKWFARIALQISNAMEIGCVSKYRIAEADGTPDMLALSLLFTPVHVPAEDPSGFAPVGSDNPLPSECALVKRVPHIVKQGIDVDSDMQADAELRRRAEENSAELLVQARYDRNAYAEYCAELGYGTSGPVTNE